MTIPFSSDRELAEAFLRGNPEAHRAIVRLAAGVVRHGGWRFSDPEDVIADIVLCVFRAVQRNAYRGEGPFGGYVVRIARCRAITHWRKEKLGRERENPIEQFERDGTVELDHPGGKGPEDDLLTADTLEYILQRLSARCRRLFGLVYFEGRTTAEVARILEITETNVRVTHFRCLREGRRIADEIVASGGTLGF